MKPWAMTLSAGLIATGFIGAATIYRSKQPENAVPRVSVPAPAPALQPSNASANDANVVALQQEVAVLRAEVQKLREEKAAEATNRQQEQKATADLAKKPGDPVQLPPDGPPKPEEIPALQASAMDTNKPAEDRVKALSRLRSVSDGRTREVVASMLQLLQVSQDARIRADILRHIHRSLPGDLRGPVLDRMRVDTDAKVREEAAETLGPLNGDPVVRAALEQAAQNDPDRKVRAQALKSLSDQR